MAFYNHRSAFIALLGGKCEECGDKRPTVLVLAPRGHSEERKINILLRMKAVDLEALKEDFQLLCLNCRAVWESKQPEFERERKREAGRRNQKKWLGKKKLSPEEEEEKEEEKPKSIGDVEATLRDMLKSSNKTLVEMAKRRLKFEFGLDLA